MKFELMAGCLSSISSVLSLQSVVGRKAPTSESQLLQEFNNALKAKDKGL